ncbi:DMT family transporter [Hasllibacter sp. MH4015]|uniref:DMT family transporter n=1 Tax=Hasllibacter sp. MH4015 TaxID=2854029 RepID=UPI001CD7CAE8|nr:DMT family transporter [Hasllibacter sp. MH4015]
MEHPAPPAQAARAIPGSNPGWGIFWMLLTGVCFVAVTATVKVVGDSVPPTQAGFLRYVLGLVFLIPMWPSVRRTKLDGSLGALFLARGLAHALAVSMWFFAMTRIPIADVTALNYLNPVYVILLAVIFLGERLGPWRIAAVAIAFVGTFVIIRPGFREIDVGHVVMLGTAVAMSVSYFLAKLLSARVPAEVVVFYLSIIVPLALLPVVLPTWVPVSWVDLGWLFLCAALATAGHYTMTLAFRAAPLAVTQPVTFLQLIWATALGVLVFGEPVDAFVILGGAMIIAAVSFITWREALRGRKGPVAEAVEKTP